MNKAMVWIICGLALTITLPVTASEEPKTNQVFITYDTPKNPDYQHVYSLMKDERKTLEKIKEFLSPYRLRWPIELLATECDGEADCWYGDGTITICYEFVDELWRNMATEPIAGIRPLDTVVGPFVDTVLHEFAHALFDYIYPPVLGREEDAADQVGALIYLSLDKHDARRLITGTVWAYIKEVEDTDPPDLDEFADEHSTTEQRRFILLCMAYGSDPKFYKDLAAWGGLPDFRAEICVEEYENIKYAFDTLIGPYIDKELAQKVYSKTWLPEIDSPMLNRDDSN